MTPFFIIFGILALVFLLFVIVTVVSAFRRLKRRISSDLLGGLGIGDLRNAIRSGAAEAANPTERTLFGATSIYMPRVLRDFPDYHFPEAKNSIRLLMNEYLKIRFGQAEGFEHSIVEESLASSVTKDGGVKELTDYRFHDCAIRGYVKTAEYATIIYVATLGYTAGGVKAEERYQVESTLKLSEDGIPKELLICPQCGGTIDNTAQKTCPYCGSGIVWDTVLSWRFTSISEC